MASLNQCQFMGNLGQDPELKSLPSGNSVANFSIAVTEKWNDKTTGEKKESTEWIPVTFYGKAAENIAKYLKKGSPIWAQGKWKTRSWEQDGKKHYKTELQGESFQMLGQKSDSQHSAPVQNNNIPNDDLPF